MIHLTDLEARSFRMSNELDRAGARDAQTAILSIVSDMSRLIAHGRVMNLTQVCLKELKESGHAV